MIHTVQFSRIISWTTDTVATGVSFVKNFVAGEPEQMPDPTFLETADGSNDSASWTINNGGSGATTVGGGQAQINELAKLALLAAAYPPVDSAKTYTVKINVVSTTLTVDIVVRIGGVETTIALPVGETTFTVANPSPSGVYEIAPPFQATGAAFMVIDLWSVTIPDTGDFADTVTHTAGQSGADLVWYEVDWTTHGEPVFGDAVAFVYDATVLPNLYTDSESEPMASSTQLLTNCDPAQDANGFPAYPSGLSTSIIQADLTSVGAIGGGDLQGGTQTFDADGMECGSTFGVLYTPTAQQVADLGVEGMIRFEVESGWITQDLTLAADEYISAHTGGASAGWTLLKQSTGKLLSRPTTTFSDGNDSDALIESKGTHTTVHIYWDATHTVLCLDGLPVMNLIEKGGLADRFTQYIIGGNRTLSGGGAKGYKIKNLEVISTAPVFPAHKSLADFYYFGDSITYRGNVSPNMGDVLATRYDPVFYFAGYGFIDQSGTVDGVGGAFADEGWQSVFTRDLLNSQQLVPSGNGHNDAVAGSTIEHAITRQGNYYTGGGTSQMASGMIGTNNCTNGGNRWGTTVHDAFEANYKTFLTRFYNEGLIRVNIARITTLSASAVGSFTPSEIADMNLNVDDANAIIDALKAWTIAQGYGADFLGVSDFFNALGGHGVGTSWQTYFPVDDIHPNALGNVAMGQAMALTALEVA